MSSGLSKKLLSALYKSFGFKSFRNNQQEIITSIIKGKDVFAVMPTGGGKSLCYQLPAMIMDGTAIVVSPLISLMKDQVDAALENGIHASYLNSTLSIIEKRNVESCLLNGTLDILYVSPERFAMSEFENLLQTSKISFVAVDEAHCISEWGHDFRPDYLALSHIKKKFPNIHVSAFTATATNRVQESIIKNLNLENPFIVRASFDRPNLHYRIIPKENANKQIIKIVKDNKHEPGIIYRMTRKNVDSTVKLLRLEGINAVAYHAGMSDEDRHKNQELFNKDEALVVVATIAFGMGIDKSNVRFIIHADLPKNIEGYYQETGRAGRDGEPSVCTLLFSRGDIPRLLYFIDQIDNEQEMMLAKKNLNSMVSYAETNICRRKNLLRYFNEDYKKDNCENCDICKGESKTEDCTVDAQKIISAVVRSGQRFGASHVSDIVLGASTKKIKMFGHDKLKTWGVGNNKPKTYWMSIINNCVAQKVLTQTDGKFPILTLGEKAPLVLKNKMIFSILKHKESNATKKKYKRNDFIGLDMTLFDELREFRRKIAKKRGVPPYIIFSDKSLRGMASDIPTTKAEFSNIHGVGEKKLEEYADAFLSVIRNYKEENKLSHKTISQ